MVNQWPKHQAASYGFRRKAGVLGKDVSERSLSNEGWRWRVPSAPDNEVEILQLSDRCPSAVGCTKSRAQPSASSMLAD